jgi:hypothetical protein
MTRLGHLKVLVLALVLLLAVPGTALASQASNKTIKSVINNPTTVITPPVDPNPPGDTTTVTVTGSSSPNTHLKILNNGQTVAQTTTTDDGTFSVPVPLQDGRNVISAQKPSGETSKPITITRVPAWWQHWGKKVAVGIGVAVALSILYFVAHWWWTGRKRLIAGDDDENQS